MSAFILSFSEVFLLIPRMIINVITRIIRVVPVFIGLFGCVYETVGTLVLYPMNFFTFILNFLSKGALPCSRSLMSIGYMIKDLYNRLYESVFTNTPSYLKPFVYLMVKIYKIGYLSIELIGVLLPQIWNYGWALAFWYTIGAPYLVYVEENPSRANDTIEVFVRAFALMLNTVIGVADIVITVYDVVLPVWWQIVWFSYQYGYLLVQYVGHAVGLVPSIQYFTYYDPFNDIARTFMLPQDDLASGSSELRGEIKRKLDEAIPHLLWESIDESLNIELRHFRRQMLSISDNPVFSQYGQNPTFNLGASSAAVAQTILIILVRGFEVLGDMFYIFFEIMLINLTLFASVWIALLSLIPKGMCASKNPGCAVQEAGISVLEDFVKAIQLDKLTGPINIPGCSPQTLGDVPCTCSVEEGGIYRSLPPCDSPFYNCLVQPGDKGALYFSQNQDGQSNTVVKSTSPGLGCPSSYNAASSTGRLLSRSTKCHHTCIIFDKDAFTQYGWEFKICGDDRYFIGSCTEGNKRTQRDDTRRSLLSNPSYNKIYMEKLKSISPEGWTYKDIKDFPAQKKPMTPESFTTIDSIMGSISSYSSINDAFLNSVCKGIRTTDFPLGENVYYSEVIQTTICLIRAYLKKDNMETRRKTSEDVKVPSLEDLYINTGSEEGPELPKSALHFYMKPFIDAGDSMLKEHKNPLQILEVFHLSMIHAHKSYVKQFNPDHVSPIGSTRGLLPMMVATLSNVYVNKSLDHMEEYKERIKLGHNVDMFKYTTVDEHGYFRRNMLSNAYNSGRLSSICGFDGYSCPDGTCAPNGDPRKCQACQDYTTSCILKSIPHAINTGFEGIDIAFIFTGWGECWRDITLNPNRSPLQAFIDGKIKIFGVDPITWPSNIRFCFPLTPPLPLLPQFTWSYLKFIAQICGDNSVSNGNVGSCMCEQYGMEVSISNTYTEYVVGLKSASIARLNKSIVGLSYIFSRFVPPYLSSVWTSLVTFFYCFPEECPRLAFLFDYEYNNYGQSEVANLICFFANSMSFLYSYLFFYVPLVIFFLYARKLSWELSTLVTDILQYIGKWTMDYFHHINATYTIEDYSEFARVVDSVGDDKKEKLLKDDPGV